ncbi:MAG: hypothetical protein AAFU61_07755 [Pseudomonadota bacterium]
MTHYAPAAALLLSLAFAAPAAALSVVETEDFADSQTMPSPIALDFGVNTISGVLFAADGMDDPTDGVPTLYDDDWLAFTLPPGGALTSARLIAATLPTAVGAGGFSFNARICNEFFFCIFETIDAALPLPVEFPVTSNQPVSPELDAYFALVTSPRLTPGIEVFCPGAVGCGWTVEATVRGAAVPLPASAALLTLGLAGLMLRRART